MMGYALDTVLRTPTGTTTVGELKEDIEVLNDLNEPVKVLSVSLPLTSRLVRISFPKQGAQKQGKEHIVVTHDQEMSIVADQYTPDKLRLGTIRETGMLWLASKFSGKLIATRRSKTETSRGR
jgi:hypothetical protein